MAAKKKFLLVDAHALIHRAYHALPPLTTKDGTPVGAVYGYLRILMSALREINPSYVAITFDSPGKTFRHERFPDYKGTRKETDEELKVQFPLVQEVMKAFGFPIYALEGYEADDLIGTVCAQFDGSNVETIIVTGDMDLLQLVDKDTKVMRLHKGIKDTLIYDEALVKAKHGYTPAEVVEYKALRGDTSDNIPGVKGIGEKGALTLLGEYGSVEEIFKNVEHITGRNKKPLEAEGAKESALLSRELATIAQDAPIEFDLEAARVGNYNEPLIREYFQQFEFRSLLKELPQLPGFQLNEGLFANPEIAAAEESTTEAANAAAEERKAQFTYTLIQTQEEIAALAEDLRGQEVFAFDTETTGLNPHQDDLVGISFSWEDNTGYYIPCGPHAPHDHLTQVPGAIAAIFADPTIGKTAHNVKFDLEVLHHAGVETAGVVFDSMIASFLVGGGKRGNGLDNLAYVEFGHEMQPITELIGTGRKQISMAEVPVEDASWYACEDADFTWRLYKLFKERLNDSENESIKKLFDEIELPTTLSLVRIEEEGMKLDTTFLANMSTTLHKQINSLNDRIQELAGAEFNVASTQQLSEILFDKMGLPTDKIKKTKKGYSTAASELDKLRGTHEIIDLISEFREVSKLANTYVDTLPELINPETNRVHTNFSQVIAATGRLSSSDPNLQNIPIRTELGREIRKAFIAEDGKKILALDYSQVELRVVAHLSGDEVMTKSFLEGADIHSSTAAALNECEINAVSKELRRQAKAINFGILYGMGVQGIMRDSGVSRDEARAFLDKYFEVHAGIKQYIEDVKQRTRENGYAETLFGRRRAFPEINSSNRMVQAGAERAAVNMPVQGTAADIMKMAMVEVDKAILAGEIDARMVLQVHDELVFEVDNDKVESEATKIKEIMESVASLNVPLVVDVEVGDSWGELSDV